MSLTTIQKNTIQKFLREQEVVELYKEYQWKNDTWHRGFPDLICIEKKISNAARKDALKRSHLLLIAEWGNLFKRNAISCPDTLNIQLYQDNVPIWSLIETSDEIMGIVDEQITGFGPTYCSKLLHFAVPEIFCALDTRLVRTFGFDNKNPVKYPFLNLKVTKYKKNPWSIPPNQKGWPGEYKTWILIINEFARMLNEKRIPCPHPQKYYRMGLRKSENWLPADVETALFSYTYREIGGKKRKCKKPSCIEEANEKIKECSPFEGNIQENKD